MRAAGFSHVAALVPVRSLAGSKTRLGEPLDPEERAELVLALLRRVVDAAAGCRRVEKVAVVSRDPELLMEAAGLGVAAILQRGEGLNEGLAEARARIEDGWDALLVLPADLPGATPQAVEELIAAAASAAVQRPDCPAVALVPDRHGTGTNALLISPPDAIEFRFGEGSRAAHAAEADRIGAAFVELEGPLSFDLDTPEDLLEADRRGLDHEAGR